MMNGPHGRIGHYTRWATHSPTDHDTRWATHRPIEHDTWVKPTLPWNKTLGFIETVVITGDRTVSFIRKTMLGNNISCNVSFARGNSCKIRGGARHC